MTKEIRMTNVQTLPVADPNANQLQPRLSGFGIRLVNRPSSFVVESRASCSKVAMYNQ